MKPAIGVSSRIPATATLTVTAIVRRWSSFCKGHLTDRRRSSVRPLTSSSSNSAYGRSRGCSSSGRCENVRSFPWWSRSAWRHHQVGGRAPGIQLQLLRGFQMSKAWTSPQTLPTIRINQSSTNHQFAWSVKCNGHSCGPANRWGYLNYWVSCLIQSEITSHCGSVDDRTGCRRWIESPSSVTPRSPPADKKIYLSVAGHQPYGDEPFSLTFELPNRIMRSRSLLFLALGSMLASLERLATLVVPFVLFPP